MKKAIILIIALLVALFVTYLVVRTPIARSMNAKGLESFKKTEFSVAENYFAKALRWKKNYSDALINLVKSQLEQQKPDEAKANLQKLIARSPLHAETEGLQGQIMVMEENYKGAIDKLTAAIKADSLLAYAYFYRAIANANLDNLEAAAEDYLKAQTLDRSNKEAFEKGAIVFGRLENFNAAILNYDKLLELDPSNTEAFFKRGTFKMKISDHKGAIADFNQAIKLNPNNPEAYFNRGTSYATMQELEKAIPDYEKAAAMNFKTAKAYYNSGLASHKLQRYDDAMKYLQKAIRADEAKEYSGMAYYILGVTEMMRNKSAKAIEYFNESIKIDANSADAYFNRAIAYGAMLEYQKAIQDLDKCIALGKKSSDVYYARGVQRISLNNFQDGCADISEAVKMGSQQAVAIQQQYCK